MLKKKVPAHAGVASHIPTLNVAAIKLTRGLTALVLCGHSSGLYLKSLLRLDNRFAMFRFRVLHTDFVDEFSNCAMKHLLLLNTQLLSRVTTPYALYSSPLSLGSHTYVVEK